MTINRRTLLAGAAAAPALSALPAARARAQGTPTIRIGVLNDQSGLYRDLSGPSSVGCVRQALEASEKTYFARVKY